MNKEEILKEIMKLPKSEIINPISTMNSINFDDLMSAVDRLNKVPTYDELLKENKRQKEAIDKAIELLGNYKHYSTPDEKQNSENEDLVNNAFDILKEVK